MDNRTNRIARSLLAASYQIQHINSEDDWELAEQVENIALRVGVRPNRNKDVGLVAMMGDQVVGGAFIGIEEDHSADQPEPWYEYSFDVVVDPNYRWGRKIGIDLIKAAEKERAFYEEVYNGNVRTRLYVINPKLSKFLQEHHGYDLESEHEGGSSHLTKW